MYGPNWRHYAEDNQTKTENVVVGVGHYDGSLLRPVRANVDLGPVPTPGVRYG